MADTSAELTTPVTLTSRAAKRVAEILASEGEGTMLDHTVFLYGTGISDSNTHFHDDLPIAVVGGKAAGIKGGRYIRQPKGTPLANLHMTILDSLGLPMEKFGDSTGMLTNLGDSPVGPV